MHKIYDVKEKLIDELEEYSDKSKLSRDDVESIKYLSSAIDHICNILEDAEEYSGNMGGRSYRYDGRSYARRRDARGRYSSAEDDFMREMKSLMAEAPNDHIRQKMQNIMSEM